MVRERQRQSHGLRARSADASEPAQHGRGRRRLHLADLQQDSAGPVPLRWRLSRRLLSGAERSRSAGHGHSRPRSRAGWLCDWLVDPLLRTGHAADGFAVLPCQPRCVCRRGGRSAEHDRRPRLVLRRRPDRVFAGEGAEQLSRRRLRLWPAGRSKLCRHVERWQRHTVSSEHCAERAGGCGVRG